MAIGSDCGLLLRTGVQFEVSYTTIETQVVFKILITLVTSQLAIAGQLEREIHPQRIGLFLGSRDRNNLKKDILADKTAGNRFALF